jgi:hypothetical protein
MAGKNHVARSIAMYVDDSGGTARDLTSSLVPGSLSGGGLSFEEAEMTGQNQTVRNYLTNHANAPITAQFRMDDTATTGSYTVLIGVDGGAAGTVTLQWGQSGAAPTSSDPEWEGEFVLTVLTASISDGGAVLDATFMPSGGTDPAWGTVT